MDQPEKKVPRNRILREILVEIKQDKKKQSSFPHWRNWGNWYNWNNWYNWGNWRNW